MAAVEQHRRGTHVDARLVQGDEAAAGREPQRRDDAVRVHLARLGLPHRDRGCPLVHEGCEQLALGGAEQLGVAQARGRSIPTRDDRAHAHGDDTRDGTATDLVAADHDGGALGEERSLDLESGVGDGHGRGSTPSKTSG